MTERVRQILSSYSGRPGVRTNMSRILHHGTLGGTGYLCAYPVDQRGEHGAASSFAENPAGYDPLYHMELAVETGCSLHVAPLGPLELGAEKYAPLIPLILKVNSGNLLYQGSDPCPAVTASVENALRLGCAGIGFTVYPGSAAANRMFEQLQEVFDYANRCGLVKIIWVYPRGSGLSLKVNGKKVEETAIDVVAYAAALGAEYGADIIKVKFPTDYVREASKDVYRGIPIATGEDRVRHVVQCAFNGKRIVLFSGGEKKSDEAMLDEVRAIRAGGGFGSIMGRNGFKRPHDQAVKLFRQIMAIYAGTEVPQAEAVSVGAGSTT